ncbi:MAG: DNA topoisomerase 4 subunit A, partial [Christensenellaceae bacterium]|nr:DNA topoisomerase 4 subunit A [Christensenellaceae bacterium]
MAKARGIDLERIREILSKTKIVPRKINDELGRSFVAYAMEVNVNRAIPDVCDGLKPVQRRILYAMNEINNTHDKAYKKCARTVGEVLGKYHPHGDSSIYDALVRMAQDFTMRMPLIDGHGNFGSVDNDPAAASRYTEARLAKVASILLQDLEKDTVNFCPNFDDTETQPVVLPAGFPNLLVNGSDGIAVALATHIPPHNLGDVIDATCALIDNPESEIEDLIKIVRCPDYPTGGVILGHNAILKAYKTGHGGIIIRSKYEIEETDTKTRIIVTEIPYNVCKEDLIGDVRTLMKDKKIEGIAYINDESDRFGMRIVIDVKRDAQANVVINSLFKQTKFQISTGILMVALDKGVPKQMNLKEILQCYIAHRFQVVTRRTEFQLRKALEKAHILEGLVIALDNLDEVIRIIKTSKDTPDARERLMQTFGLSEKQSNAILDMRLARLTSLEATKIRAELRELEIAIADWRDILAKPERVYVIVKTELNEVKTSFPSPRRSEPVYGEDEDIDMGDLI